MQKTLRLLMAAAVAAPLLTGCVDDDYDLSDIDTTARLNVKDLVVPINLDEILLENIIKVEDQVEIVDGKYAIVQSGDFTSDPIRIEKITLQTPEIAPTNDVIHLLSTEAPRGRAVTGFSYNLKSTESPFSTTSTIASDFIISIDRIGCEELRLNTRITLSKLNDYLNRTTFSNIKIQMLKGLDLSVPAGDKYDPATGIITLGDRVVSGSSLSLTFIATGIDFTRFGDEFDFSGQTIKISGSFSILEGTVSASLSDLKPGITTLPPSVTLSTAYDLSNAVIDSFSGRLRYDLDEAKLSEVELNDLPDILTQEGTNLIFAHPRIYFRMNNPLQQWDIYAQSGLSITAYRDETPQTYSINDPYFEIGRPVHADGIYNFCVSPDDNPAADAAYPEAQPVKFTDLCYVLSGNGVPQRLSFDLGNPKLPTQNVSDFTLGRELGSFSGNYKFVAPLQFEQGSQITYSDKVDGWYDDDLENLTISALELSLNITTDLPVEATLSGYPIDVEGNRINNAQLTEVTIPANADNEAVKLHLTEEISGLDGIVFEAHVKAATEGETLSPDMTMKLTNIRPKVSGYYVKEL